MTACTCRATGTCPTCRYYARVAADAFARMARRAAERRSRDMLDNIDDIGRRIDAIEMRMARAGVR